MFPTSDFQTVVQWLRTGGAPSLAVYRAVFSIGQYVIDQLGGAKAAAFAAAAPAATSKEECARVLEHCCEHHAAFAAGANGEAGVSWATVIAVVLKILQLLA